MGTWIRVLQWGHLMHGNQLHMMVIYHHPYVPSQQEVLAFADLCYY